MLSGDGSVYLRGCQFRVSEEILDASQICASFEEMRGVRMTECMGKCSEAILDDAADASRVERPAPNADPESVSAGGPGEHGTSSLEIGHGRSPRLVTDRYRPLLVALPVHRDEMSLADVARGHRCELGDPHSGSVEDFEKCAVAKIDGIGTIEIIEEPFECWGRDGLRKCPGTFRLRDTGSRVRGDRSSTCGIFEECSNS